MRHASSVVAGPTPRSAPALDPYVRTARGAGLRYVSDREPGFARKRAGKGFAYYTAAGARVQSSAQLARIRKLAIPPA